jgi:hypothetical protein
MIEVPSARDTLRELTTSEMDQIAGGHGHGHGHGHSNINFNIVMNFYIFGSNNVVGVDLTGLSSANNVMNQGAGGLPQLAA